MHRCDNNLAWRWARTAKVAATTRCEMQVMTEIDDLRDKAKVHGVPGAEGMSSSRTRMLHFVSRHTDQLKPMAQKETLAMEQRVVTRVAEAQANARIKETSASDLLWAD